MKWKQGIILVICAVCFFDVLWSKGAILKGRVTYQSSGGKPVKQAVVSFSTNTLTQTDDHGWFALEFPDKKPGDVILLYISKKGLELSNEKAWVKAVLPTRPDGHPKLISMRKIGQKEKWQEEYYQKAKNAIKSNYQKKLNRLKKNLNEKDQVISKLKQQMDDALKQASDMASYFAGKNLDEATDMYKKALKLFLKGEIKKALTVLDEAKIDQSIRDSKRVIREQASNLMLKAQVHIANFDFDKAESCFKKAVEADPGNIDNVIVYNRFHLKQNEFIKPLELNKKSLYFVKGKYDKAVLLNNLGLFCNNNGLFDESKEYYKESLKIYRDLARVNPAAYRPDVAGILNNLGNMYYKTTRFSDAESAYKEALEIYRDLARVNPAAYRPDVAITLNNLGLFFFQTDKNAEAERHFNEALKIRRKLVKLNSGAYDMDLCQTIISLSLIYGPSPENKTKALSLLDEAISILKKYPNVPYAEKCLKLAEKLKNKFTQPSGNK